MRLFGTTSVLTALFTGAPTLDRLKAALPALLFILAVSIFRTGMTLIADWNEDRLMPDVARTVERRLYAATTSVELAAFDTPGSTTPCSGRVAAGSPRRRRSFSSRSA